MWASAGTGRTVHDGQVDRLAKFGLGTVKPVPCTGRVSRFMWASAPDYFRAAFSFVTSGVPSPVT
jgi:hypothetical protein